MSLARSILLAAYEEAYPTEEARQPELAQERQAHFVDRLLETEPGKHLVELTASAPLLLKRVKPPVVAPGQVEAFEWVAPPCTRCGRKLTHPHWLNGAPFGRDCYRKEGMA